MNIIYNKTVELFASEEGEVQQKIFNDIKQLVENSLKNKDDNLISDALLQAEKENKLGIWNHINTTMNNCVNKFEYSKDGIDYVSRLIVLPYIILPTTNTITLPPLQELENWWKQNLADNFLVLPNEDEINFIPIVLGKNAAINMSMSDWYKIHRANSLHLEIRNTRAMFVQSFNIQIPEDTPSLSFFVATINRRKDCLVDNPLLDSTSNILDNLDTCLKEMNNIYSSQIYNSSWLFLPIGVVSDIVPNSFDTYQDLLASRLISRHVNQEYLQFIVVPTSNNDEPTGFALVVWNKQKNLVLDALLLSSFTRDYNQLIDMIMNHLNEQNVASLYIGDVPIDYKEFGKLVKLNFQQYIKRNGAHLLSCQ